MHHPCANHAPLGGCAEAHQRSEVLDAKKVRRGVRRTVQCNLKEPIEVRDYQHPRKQIKASDWRSPAKAKAGDGRAEHHIVHEAAPSNRCSRCLDRTATHTISSSEGKIMHGDSELGGMQDLMSVVVADAVGGGVLTI
jgi:hypothetical protein